MNTAATNRPARLLILDDHPLVLDGLASTLSQEVRFEVAGKFSREKDAAAFLDASPVDVAIVDIKLRDGLSFDFVEAARARYPGLKVVFITAFDDDLLIERAAETGNCAVVHKADPLDELTKAVDAVMAGTPYISRQVRERYPDLPGREGLGATRLSGLTPREREILRLVSLGMSAKEISRALKISAWTVTNHKANIMAKLDIHNQVGLTRFAVSTGLIEA